MAPRSTRSITTGARRCISCSGTPPPTTTLSGCRLPPHRTPPQRTHRTAHPRRRSHHPLAPPCAQADAIGSLLEPMLEAGADPSIPRKLDGLRPYDLLSRVARYGPWAVLAVRKGALTLSALSAGQLVDGRLFVPGSPPIAVSHTLSQLDLSPADQPEQGRWRRHAAELEERARRLDQQRRMFTAVALQLLLWRQRAAAASGGHPVGALPEELLFDILLSACTDHGQHAELQRRFEAVAAHLTMASKYERRSAALAARLPTGDEEVQQLARSTTRPARRSSSCARSRARTRTRTARRCAPSTPSCARPKACSTAGGAARARRRTTAASSLPRPRRVRASHRHAGCRRRRGRRVARFLETLHSETLDWSMRSRVSK